VLILRSHALLILTVEQKLLDGSLRLSKLNLADLAGSERVKDSQVTPNKPNNPALFDNPNNPNNPDLQVSGMSLEEASKINLALSSLGRTTLMTLITLIPLLAFIDRPIHNYGDIYICICLGLVINTLSSSTRPSHVPYRYIITLLTLITC